MKENRCTWKYIVLFIVIIIIIGFFFFFNNYFVPKSIYLQSFAIVPDVRDYSFRGTCARDIIRITTSFYVKSL